MKKIALICLVLIIGFGFISAEDKVYTHPLKWYSPELMGQGNSTTANITGYNALFCNPAGIRTDKTEITAFSIQPSWSMDIFTFLDEHNSLGFAEALLNQAVENGMGIGAQTSIGFARKGLGMAVFLSIDSLFPQVTSIPNVKGDVWATAGFVAGYSLDLNLLGLNWKIGADLRPMYRMLFANIDANNIIDFADDIDSVKFDRLAGFGLGFDLGVQTTWKSLTFGVALKDVAGTTFHYKYAESDYKGKKIPGTETNLAEKFIVPMTLRTGVCFHPQLFYSNFIDPKFHIDYTLPLYNEDKIIGSEKGTFWTNLCLGTEVTIFEILDLRAGLNGGYFSAGLGLDLWVFEISAALYSQELGAYAGHKGTMGGVVEFSVKL